MKPKFIDYFMKVAELTATLSYARRLKVGSIIVKDDRIISIGYNGMPAGWENNCEDMVYANEWTVDNQIWEHEDEEGIPYNLKTKPEVLHSESNAIAKVSRSTESSDGATLFCTHSPCIECAKLIHQAGIATVYYKEKFRSDDGLNFLRKSGINVHKYSDRT